MFSTKQQPTDLWCGHWSNTPTVVLQVVSANLSMAEAFLGKAELSVDVWASFLSYSCDKIPDKSSLRKDLSGLTVQGYSPSWWGWQGSRSERQPATLHPVKQERATHAQMLTLSPLPPFCALQTRPREQCTPPLEWVFQLQLT